MKFITDTDITDYVAEFTPTSVYLDGVQTYAYSTRGTTVFFNNTVPAGTEVTLMPPDAVKFDDGGIVQVDITEVGWHSVFSEPFGELEFSADNVTWVKSLSMTYPATIYVRYIPKDPVLDVLCRGNIEIVIWKGPADTKINEDGLVESFKELPLNSFVGGIEFYVH